jgi:hypothetical protein
MNPYLSSLQLCGDEFAMATRGPAFADFIERSKKSLI